jgi:hypothetical protein
MRLIVRELGRPEAEIVAKAEELGIVFGTRHFDRLAHLDKGDAEGEPPA